MKDNRGTHSSIARAGSPTGRMALALLLLAAAGSGAPGCSGGGSAYSPLSVWVRSCTYFGTAHRSDGAPLYGVFLELHNNGGEPLTVSLDHLRYAWADSAGIRERELRRDPVVVPPRHFVDVRTSFTLPRPLPVRGSPSLPDTLATADLDTLFSHLAVVVRDEYGHRYASQDFMMNAWLFFTPESTDTCIGFCTVLPAPRDEESTYVLTDEDMAPQDFWSLDRGPTPYAEHYGGRSEGQVITGESGPVKLPAREWNRPEGS